MPNLAVQDVPYDRLRARLLADGQVHHAGGVTVVPVNQREVPPIENLWVPLGVFEFAAGQPAAVVVSNAGADGHVIIDAVQWLRQ
jgi:hypothetical protein